MSQLYHTAVFNDPEGNMVKYKIETGRVAGSNTNVPFTGYMEQYMDSHMANCIWNIYPNNNYWKINSKICSFDDSGIIFYSLSWCSRTSDITVWTSDCFTYSLSTICGKEHIDSNYNGSSSPFMYMIIYSNLQSPKEKFLKTTRSGKQY